MVYLWKSRLSDVRKYNNSWTGSIHIYTHIYLRHVHNSPRLFVLYSCNFWCIFENQYISVTFDITEIPILIGVVITIELKLFFWIFAFTIWLQFSTVLFSYTEQDMSDWNYGRVANRSIPIQVSGWSGFSRMAMGPSLMALFFHCHRSGSR